MGGLKIFPFHKLHGRPGNVYGLAMPLAKSTPLFASNGTMRLTQRLVMSCKMRDCEILWFSTPLRASSAQRITVMRKSNAGELSGRQWRSVHGVVSIEVGDTRLRCMMQGWMDYLQQTWLNIG